MTMQEFSDEVLHNIGAWDPSFQFLNIQTLFLEKKSFEKNLLKLGKLQKSKTTRKRIQKISILKDQFKVKFFIEFIKCRHAYFTSCTPDLQHRALIDHSEKEAVKLLISLPYTLMQSMLFTLKWNNLIRLITSFEFLRFRKYWIL